MNTSPTATAAEFLFREAELLDSGAIDEWIALLTDDFELRVPVRATRYGRHQDEFSATSHHFLEDLYSMTKRADRLKTRFAWAEDPPSRSRHFVTNVRVESEAVGGLVVHSNLLLFKTRADDGEIEILSGSRVDHLRLGPVGLRLAKRVVFLDQTVLPVGTISTFL